MCTVSTVDAPRMRSVSRALAGGSAIVLLGASVGVLSAGNQVWAGVLAVLAVVAAAAVIDLSILPVVAVPASMMVDRVGPMSVADLVLGVATVVALLLVRGKNITAMQPLLWAGGTYVALTAPQLILNPYLGNAIEWAHELVLVLGSMVVGFVVGRDGFARLALGAYTLIACGIAVTTVFVATSQGFGPVYLGMLHKNAIGGILVIAGLTAYANPPWLNWRPSLAYLAFAVCGVGMLAAQSRQAIVGLLIGVIIVSLRPRHQTGKRARWIWFLLIPAAYFVYAEVSAQLGSSDPFNSASQRLLWYEESITVWLQSPLFGVGHRWWIAGYAGVSGFQPPNAELEVLTTVGIVGLVGFLAMFASSLWLTSRMEFAYGTLAFAVIASKLVQGQFDLYWVAGQSSILWIVAGVCYGVRERDRAHEVVRVPHPVQTLFRRSSPRG